ncbi:3-oxosteroid 1-dehydrogenase [Croceicoccus estronivorus]|uniref:FAD-dependent oxidoreductase n=1 Tax=Croceicoccus estronivorus TaxID=1172626 RepID=UPI00082F46C6|nr:FAD-dependent oxidoreductase [Croceicoccus estronivorus]OCC23385.1 3-oxosteroid 1-dehydrogenase [Croceicoccus estronivorus]
MQSDSFDVVIVGSGAGGMTAAIRAHDLGLSVLMIEKTAAYGGTSATSGGGLWIPCNHLMEGVGVPDDREDALAYMRSLVGNDVPDANVVAFVDSGHEMLRWLHETTDVRYIAMPHYADYYQEQPGARAGARSIDPLPYDARRLGADFANMQAQHRQVRVMGLIGYTNSEGAVLLSKAPGWRKVVASLVWRYVTDLGGRIRSMRSRRLTMGNALTGGLRKAMLDRDIPLWLNTPARELLAENGEVQGVIVERGDTSMRIHARCGVILASGGFEHNQALREQHLPQPTDESWSAASPANRGDMLHAAQAIGASTSLLDEAWWSPTITLPGEDRARALFTERSMPGAIVVNQAGHRFFNESTGYTAAAQAMFAPGNLPAYMIFDARYRREYPFGPLLPGGMRLDWMQKRSVRNGLLAQAQSIADLARKLKLDPDALNATVERFNGFAQTGADADFRRGENSYDLIYGDVRVSPNPCLAPILEPPFYGVEIHAGDIGTKGGVACDEDARVLDGTGNPIPGLYAVGNVSASVTGRHYPGAGATLGPAMTFAFRAANHLHATATGRPNQSEGVS